MVDDDEMCFFAIKTGGFCCLLNIAIILFACSFAVLEPLELGIEYNLNSRQIYKDSVAQGGRHFLGLGHEWKKFPANRMIFSFMDESRPLGGTEEEDCDLADECETGAEDCTPCLAGQMPAEDADLVGKNFVVKAQTLPCRSYEGLIIQVEAAAGISLGLGRDNTLGDKSDAPQVSDQLKETLFGLFETTGDENWRGLVQASIAAAIRTEVSQHNALEFYTKREIIGQLMQQRVTTSLLPLNCTTHRVSLVAVQLPTGLESAIQDTELARQAKEAAIFAKETAEIDALTKVEVAKVERDRLLHAALRNAEMTLLQKVAQAILIQYDTEQLGDAFVTGADTMQYNNSKQTLLLKWLYTLQEVGAQKLVFEMPQPEQLALDYEPTSAEFAQSSPTAVASTSLLSLAGLNSTFSALQQGLSPTLAAVSTATANSTTASNSSRLLLMETALQEASSAFVNLEEMRNSLAAGSSSSPGRATTSISSGASRNGAAGGSESSASSTSSSIEMNRLSASFADLLAQYRNKLGEADTTNSNNLGDQQFILGDAMLGSVPSGLMESSNPDL
ncbi:unnamed protein product [Amoebophrya sp. A120]|nr:unnamed protein product [Amoebophrya sp. A120]|eukprot:GSA120T00021760001.1